MTTTNCLFSCNHKENDVFVAKMCNYALYESSEGFCCGPRKPANPCQPGWPTLVPRPECQVILQVNQVAWKASKLEMLVGNGNCKAEKWERVYVASRVVQIIR